MKLSNEYIELLKNLPGIDYEKMIETYDKCPKVGVRFNIDKLQKNFQNAENIQNFMQKNGFLGQFSKILWSDAGYYYDGEDRLGKSILHEAGLYYLQEPSAMAPANFLDVEPDDFVLDLCASPGGKTTQIAPKLKNGFLISNEIIHSRAITLAENVHRLGFENVAVTNHSPKELEKMFAEKFDKILVDAPCSGEGMFRKTPEAILEWNSQTPKMCAERQKQIVDSAYKMLKPNGIMVYSTCTFSVEENEEVVKYLLDTYDDLEILPIEHSKYNFCNGVEIDNCCDLKNCARLYPYKIGGEGHFFAKIHKNINKNSVFLPKKQQKSHCDKHMIDIFQKWCNQFLNINFENFCSIGESLYANCKIDIDRLKIVSVGVYLGEVKKNNFVPSWHLAHCLKSSDAKFVQELTDFEAKKYIAGEEIETTNNGWTLLTYENLPLSFGKAVDGKMKNHYPKKLRKKM